MIVFFILFIKIKKKLMYTYLYIYIVRILKAIPLDRDKYYLKQLRWIIWEKNIKKKTHIIKKKINKIIYLLIYIYIYICFFFFFFLFVIKIIWEKQKKKK
jgi:hypothetical protein